MHVEQVVFVISGESKARRGLADRVRRLGLECREFVSPEDFQQSVSPADSGCILLHVAHAEIDLDWLAGVGRVDAYWPVIGIAAEADVDTAVSAMKRGACDFVLEGCGDLRLRAALDGAFHRYEAQRRFIIQAESIRSRLMQLTPPLRDVFDLVLKGRSNREIADELDVSVRTIEVRRAKVMRTMKARTVVKLVRQALLVNGFGPLRALQETAQAVHNELG